MIEAIIFDLDGTLIGQKTASSKVLKQFYLENKSRFGSLAEKDFFNVWFKAGRKNLQEFVKGEITFEDKIITQIQELYKSLNSIISKNEAKKISDKFSPIYEQNLILYDDVIPCLEFLRNKGYQLGIITNGHIKDQRKKLRKFDIEKYFSPIIISGEIGFAKPSVEIFLECIRILELPPQNIIYVGDMVEMDVIGANRAGMKGVWLNREKQENKFDFDFITNLTELQNLLDQNNI